MSVRTSLSTAALTALDGDHISWTILAQLNFSDGVRRVWAGPQNAVLPYLGESWVGTGDLGSIAEVKETEQISDAALVGTLRLSDAMIDSIELADNEGRTAVFYLLIFDPSDGSILGHIEDTREMGAAWAEPSVESSGSERVLFNGLKMQFVSEGAILARRHVRRLTHEDTLQFDPYDNFNEFASDPDLERNEEGGLRTRTVYGDHGDDNFRQYINDERRNG